MSKKAAASTDREPPLKALLTLEQLMKTALVLWEQSPESQLPTSSGKKPPLTFLNELALSIDKVVSDMCSMQPDLMDETINSYFRKGLLKLVAGKMDETFPEASKFAELTIYEKPPTDRLFEAFADKLKFIRPKTDMPTDETGQHGAFYQASQAFASSIDGAYGTNLLMLTANLKTAIVTIWGADDLTRSSHKDRWVARTIDDISRAVEATNVPGDAFRTVISTMVMAQGEKHDHERTTLQGLLGLLEHAANATKNYVPPSNPVTSKSAPPTKKAAAAATSPEDKLDPALAKALRAVNPRNDRDWAHPNFPVKIVLNASNPNLAGEAFKTEGRLNGHTIPVTIRTKDWAKQDAVVWVIGSTVIGTLTIQYSQAGKPLRFEMANVYAATRSIPANAVHNDSAAGGSMARGVDYKTQTGVETILTLVDTGFEGPALVSREASRVVTNQTPPTETAPQFTTLLGDRIPIDKTGTITLMVNGNAIDIHDAAITPGLGGDKILLGDQAIKTIGSSLGDGSKGFHRRDDGTVLISGEQVTKTASLGPTKPTTAAARPVPDDQAKTTQAPATPTQQRAPEAEHPQAPTNAQPTPPALKQDQAPRNYQYRPQRQQLLQRRPHVAPSLQHAPTSNLWASGYAHTYTAPPPPPQQAPTWWTLTPAGPMPMSLLPRQQWTAPQPYMWAGQPNRPGWLGLGAHHTWAGAGPPPAWQTPGYLHPWTGHHAHPAWQGLAPQPMWPQAQYGWASTPQYGVQDSDTDPDTNDQHVVDFGVASPPPLPSVSQIVLTDASETAMPARR